MGGFSTSKGRVRLLLIPFVTTVMLAASRIDSTGTFHGTPFRVSTTVAQTGPESLRAVADLTTLEDFPRLACAKMGMGLTCTSADVAAEQAGSLLLTVPVTHSSGLHTVLQIRLTPRVSDGGISLRASFVSSPNATIRNIAEAILSEFETERIALTWFLPDEAAAYTVTSCKFVPLEASRVGLSIYLAARAQ